MTFDIHNRRYTGSKFKLISWIKENIQTKKYSSFLDIFAGTGTVSASVIEDFDKIIINDFLFSNYIIYQGFFGKGKYSKSKIDNFISSFNNTISNTKENYFSKSFGGKYFSKNDAFIIGHIREQIENNKDTFTSKEYAILLSSLIYSTDKIANTVGHFDAYRKNIKLSDRFKYLPINPIKHNKNIKIYQNDANLLIKSTPVDVLYLDPPYNSRQYSRFYHVLENLSSWQKPKLFGTARKPEASSDTTSTYCKTAAYQKLKELIESADARVIVLSYNNTYDSKSSSSKNKISLNQIKSIMRNKGKTKVLEKKYANFNAGKTNFNDHREYLFITEVS